MSPDVAQELKVIQPVQPFGIVQHDRVGDALAIGKIAPEHLSHACDIVVDLCRAQHRSFVRTEAGITHLGRAAAHQGHGFVPRLLQPAQQHDVQQMPYMQRFRRGVITDIGRNHPRDQRIVQTLKVGAIGQKSTLHDDAQEFRFRAVGHLSCPLVVCAACIECKAGHANRNSGAGTGQQSRGLTG